MTDILKMCSCGGTPKIMMFDRKYQTYESSGVSVAYYVICQSCKKCTNDNYSKIEAIGEWNEENP